MKILPIVTVFFTLVSIGLNAQSFSNVDELLQLSEQDPLECEKTLQVKGFKFDETDGLKSEYDNYNESISYRISPRMVHYQTLDRVFFLEVNSKLIKQGFVLVNSEGVLEGEGTKIKAQEYQKGKFVVWLFIDKVYDETHYHVQVDNSAPSSVKKSPASSNSKSEFKYKGDKESINYGYFYGGLMLPRGVISESPKSQTSYSQDYKGFSGIAARAGFECGIGGVLGIMPLNNVLPHALDFGIILNGNFGMQPFSYKSLGGEYDAYSYDDFVKVGAGVGPALILTPFREADFHFSFYYKLDAGLNLGGGFDYIGGESFDETLTRDAGSFAWIKTYGIHIFGGSVFGGVEFSNYIDKGEFTLTQSLYNQATSSYDSNTAAFTAALPVRQIILKIGLAF